MTLATAAWMMLSMYLVNNHFYGTVAGKLPFEPWTMVTGMSHRGLEGDDMRQYSMTFVYVLLQMAMRGFTSKLFGNEGPRMPIEH